MLTLLFCIGDVNTVLSTTTAFPFIQIFKDSVGSTAGATVMVAVVLILTWACAIGITTTASRMTWSFARDRGTPFSSLIMKVERRNQIPVVATFVVTIFAALLTLIYIGSPTAFNDVISLTITGFYGSYFLPCAFLLYHRIKGHVAKDKADIMADLPQADSSTPPQVDNKTDPEKTFNSYDPNNATNADPITVMSDFQLAWGPFKIPGILGIINNLYACLYMIFVIFWSVWPPVTPVNAQTMNYSVVVTGGVIIFSIIWYWVRGRKEYKGPLIDEEVRNVLGIHGGIIGELAA